MDIRVYRTENLPRPGRRVGAGGLCFGLIAMVVGCAAARGQSADPSASPTQRATEATVNHATGEPDPASEKNDADGQVVTFLDRLEERLNGLTSLRAALVYTAEQPLLGDKQTRLGHVSYLAGPPARFNVTFDQLLIGQALRPRQRSYIFDGTWLVERYPREKLFIKRQVVAPGQSFDPLKLGQGPFPLPLGQKREQVMGRFEVELISQPQPPQADTADLAGEASAQPVQLDGADQPTAGQEQNTESPESPESPEAVEPAEPAEAPAYHLRLTPRVDPATGKPIVDFKQVDIWYDASTLMPRKVRAVEGSSQVKTVLIRDVQLDGLDADAQSALFDTTAPAPGSGWRVEIKPWQSDPPSTPTADEPESHR